MKRTLFMLTALWALSCTSNKEQPYTPSKPENTISAEKESWVISAKASDDRAFAKDIPWKEGEKVLLLGSDQSLEDCHIFDEEGSNWVIHPTKKYYCTVTKAEGLKCTLMPDTPLPEGTYRAFYPVYDYAWYDYLHLSFLYEDWNELDYSHQDIVVSDPVEFKEDHKISVVMSHICALAGIDIFPPKDGEYTHLKLFAEYPAFAGKAEYFIDEELDVDKVASGWLNYTTLRGEGKEMKKGELFQTCTGLLPIEYDGLPMTVHIVYKDGTHYVSEEFAMPSLSLGVESKLAVKEFKETSAPLMGLMGDFYGDTSAFPYEVN